MSLEQIASFHMPERERANERETAGGTQMEPMRAVGRPSRGPQSRPSRSRWLTKVPFSPVSTGWRRENARGEEVLDIKTDTSPRGGHMQQR